MALSGSHTVARIALLDPTETRMQAAADAVSPAGDSAFFGAASEGYVAQVQVSTAAQHAAIELSTGVSEVSAIAITPDQAPTARFTKKVAGRTVTLDASASTSFFGTVAHYAWTFGDGGSSSSTSSDSEPHLPQVREVQGDARRHRLARHVDLGRVHRPDGEPQRRPASERLVHRQRQLTPLVA